MTVTLGGIAGLIAALAFLYLVVRLGGLLGKAGQILDETTVSLRTTSDNVQPTLKGLTDTVSLTNDQLTRVDSITSSVTTMTTNASALTSLTAATIGTPAHQGRGVQLRRAHRGARAQPQGPVVRGRTVLLAAAAVGVGYALWKLPVTQRFVTTVQGRLRPTRGRAARGRRGGGRDRRHEPAPRATPRGPRPPTSRSTPAGTATAPAAPGAPASALGADDPGRSLTPEEARALLLDPTGERAP